MKEWGEFERRTTNNIISRMNQTLENMKQHWQLFQKAMASEIKHMKAVSYIRT